MTSRERKPDANWDDSNRRQYVEVPERPTELALEEIRTMTGTAGLHQLRSKLPNHDKSKQNGTRQIEHLISRVGMHSNYLWLRRDDRQSSIIRTHRGGEGASSPLKLSRKRKHRSPMPQTELGRILVNVAKQKSKQKREVATRLCGVAQRYRLASQHVDAVGRAARYGGVSVFRCGGCIHLVVLCWLWLV